jgi:hypothetical protein
MDQQAGRVFYCKILAANRPKNGLSALNPTIKFLPSARWKNSAGLGLQPQKGACQIVKLSLFCVTYGKQAVSLIFVQKTRLEAGLSEIVSTLDVFACCVYGMGAGGNSNFPSSVSL